ncbi:unnamed protein product [Brassica oleracea]|uniref:(rape) hypothetical protein n=1 Tax=Brassica napus TaxID=3708 RepID=A0A816RLE3_BRANA|nr:unnamed protein product [Brassica napus]
MYRFTSQTIISLLRAPNQVLLLARKICSLCVKFIYVS